MFSEVTVRLKTALACLWVPLVFLGGSVSEADAGEPLCVDMTDRRTPCWTEVANHQGCRVQALVLRAPYSPPFTWSGRCRDGKAEGGGFLTDGRGNRAEGRLVAGLEEGVWVRYTVNGHVLRNTYEAGVLHGPASVTWKSGVHHEGEYVDGHPEGRWERHWPDGYSEVGEYRKGERHGIWTITWPDDVVALAPYVDGVLHGEMAILENGEAVGTLIYENGVREGGGLPPVLLPVADDP